MHWWTFWLTAKPRSENPKSISGIQFLLCVHASQTDTHTHTNALNLRGQQMGWMEMEWVQTAWHSLSNRLVWAVVLELRWAPHCLGVRLTGLTGLSAVCLFPFIIPPSPNMRSKRRWTCTFKEEGVNQEAFPWIKNEKKIHVSGLYVDRFTLVGWVGDQNFGINGDITWVSCDSGHWCSCQES